MDPTTLIVAALGAGASAGVIEALQSDVKETAKAAYARLRTLASRRVTGRPDAELALERHESAPRKWESLLAAELSEAGAGADDELVAAARAVMELVDQAGARAGKYNVTVTNSRGVQVGDHNIQVNRF